MTLPLTVIRAPVKLPGICSRLGDLDTNKRKLLYQCKRNWTMWHVVKIVRAGFLVPEFYEAMTKTWLDTDTGVTARVVRADFITSKNICFFLLFIYLFIFVCVGSSFLCEGFLYLWRVGATLHRGARASHCRGAQAPDAQAQWLWLTGLVAGI